MSILLHGIPVSRGIAVGTVRVLQRDHPELVDSAIPPESVEQEVDAFQRAVDMAADQLRQLRDHIPSNMPVDMGAFIDTHLLMLSDPMLRDGPAGIIREQMCNAAWALKLQRDTLVAVFEAMDDAYLRNRKTDVDHVVQRIHRALALSDKAETPPDPQWRGCIVVADDLTPADTVMMQHHGVAGFITESGGQLSHTAILARSLGIPAVVGVHNARRYLSDGEQIIVDGRFGLVLAEPDRDTIQDYRGQIRDLRRRRATLARLRDAESVTRDGAEVALRANIEVRGDLRALKQVKADGVGLYRTEFLYMNRDTPPDEAEHFETYRHIVKALDGRTLTIRTVDLGADKEVEMGGGSGPLAHNPAMGLRGIRRCLKEPGLFLPQLRAILRASAYGPVRILLPMLTTVEEIRQTRELLAQARGQLHQARQACAEQVPLGGMVEVPAAAVAAEQFAAHLDFLSIGTNDLIQYTLAIDRIDDQVNYLYDPLHPAVLNLIEQVIRAGTRRGKPVSMCGEMAGDVRYTRLLLGLGLRDFSMPPNSVLEVRHAVMQSRSSGLRRSALAIARCADRERQQRLLERLNQGLEATLPQH